MTTASYQLLWQRFSLRIEYGVFVSLASDDEEHHYQYRLFCLYSFFNKNIDDDHLIGPALLTCCVLSTTEKLKHIFSQFLPHTSALFYITPVSLSTAI